MAKRQITDAQLADLVARKEAGATYAELVKHYKKKYGVDVSEEAIRSQMRRSGTVPMTGKKVFAKSSARILFLDIETAPIQASIWRLWDENVGLNQITKDWHLLSWSAKWAGSREVIYKDQRKAKDIENDFELCSEMWKLIDEADILVTQNGKKFDIKKLNARFLFWGMQPPSSYRHIDTCEIAKKKFGFTSNKLEYMADKFTNTKKLTKRKFAGFELWRECLAGNAEAWNEMQAYNKQDVLALEEVYKRLYPWDNSVTFSVYANADNTCNCGSTEWSKNGFHYSNRGKYQRYKCKACGSETHDPKNLLDKDTRKHLRKRVP